MNLNDEKDVTLIKATFPDVEFTYIYGKSWHISENTYSTTFYDHLDLIDEDSEEWIEGFGYGIDAYQHTFNGDAEEPIAFADPAAAEALLEELWNIYKKLAEPYQYYTKKDFNG